VDFIGLNSIFPFFWDFRMVDNGESLIDIDLSDTEWQISSDLPAIFRLLD